MGRIVGKIRLNTMINLKDTLKGGQSFRFQFAKVENSYCGVAKGILFGVSGPSTSKELEYEVYGLTRVKWQEIADSQDRTSLEGFQQFFETFLHEYLGKSVHSLQDSITEFSKNVLLHSPEAFQVRLLVQERFETLMAFITSANNNIERITKLLSKFCAEFGDEIFPVEVNHKKKIVLLDTISTDFCTEHSGFRHAFPTADRIWKTCEDSVEKLGANLRLMGFGYRAPYIAETVRTLAFDECHPFYGKYKVDEFADYEKCVVMLQGLKGVGKKVADCIALYGFQFGFSVPIDVHIRRITLNEIQHKNLNGIKLDGALTVTDYKRIGDFYRLSFGQFAGLAQQVMFVYSLHRSRNSSQVSEKPIAKQKPVKKPKTSKIKNSL